MFITIDGREISVVKEEDKARKYLSFLTNELKLKISLHRYLFNYFGNLYGLDEETIKK